MTVCKTALPLGRTDFQSVRVFRTGRGVVTISGVVEPGCSKRPEYGNYSETVVALQALREAVG